MRSASILNHVLGPVMRGPSSSHTAGAFHIASMARSLLGGQPRRAAFTFDPNGSYAQTFIQQGADRAFAMGLLGRPLTDDSFFDCLRTCGGSGLEVRFEVRDLEGADHPNTVDLELLDPDGRLLRLRARSIGGGEVEMVRIDGLRVCLTGTAHEVVVEAESGALGDAVRILSADGGLMGEPERVGPGGDASAIVARRSAVLPSEMRRTLEAIPGCRSIRECAPVYFPQTGVPLFASAAEMTSLAEERRLPLGRLALEYESRLLDMSERDVLEEMVRRYEIMERAARDGLLPELRGMQLLEPSAGAVFAASAAGRLPAGGLHARAAARALAVMHVNSSMGVVCAAPTGGSAGALPGAVVTFVEEYGRNREDAAMMLFAAGAIGLIVANRATFAAEVAGCQVEIGAAGAMAAAAIVDAAGGTAAQAADAAAISFQNTMGSVCDLVQGMVEIPCHTRNAVAASSAFVCADLILGGYRNPIPLDETIDAVHSVGKLLPAELRCTVKGGIALAPSAVRLPRRGAASGEKLP